MSLILEALRKSEAERRRGEAPDLRVELPPPPAPRRRPPPVAWLAGGLVLAVLAVAAFWPRGEDAGQAAGDRTAEDDVARLRAGNAMEDASRPDRDPPRATGQWARGGAMSAGDTPPGFPAVERIEVPGGTVAPEPAPDVPLAPPPMATRAAEEAAEAAAAQPSGPARREASAATPAVPTAPPSRRDAPATGPTPAMAASTPPLSADGAIRIAGLPAGQRERLPEARLSLHMWNEDPARRFAVIDGQRRMEGDRLGEATIVAIDREGVLLDLDGQRVRLPLP